MNKLIQNIISYFVFSLFLSCFIYAHFFWDTENVLVLNSEENKPIQVLDHSQQSQQKEHVSEEQDTSQQKNIPTPQIKTAEDNLAPDSDIHSTKMEHQTILAKYIQECHNSIFPNWTVDGTLIQQNPELEATIKVLVAEDGMISNPEVVVSSGNRSFDTSAIMAMVKTKKLPPPPQEYQISAQHGVYITLAAQDR